MTSYPLFKNMFLLRRPRGANFSSFIKIATIFIKTTFKDSITLKKNQKSYIKMESSSEFLDITKVTDSQ